MGVNASRNVAVIGAGPAGIFAARELANNNHKVTIINRDIKPGGLAEYGIYPTKQKIKDGLRKQFYSILSHENVSYFGNLVVGDNADVTLQELRDIGFDAFLVTTGAQGTKWLGLPGEELKGSYHAKDLVYHFNQLPPYSNKEFSIGKKAAIIGVGNVMMDIARYLITEKHVEVVTAIARRGPAELKFTRKELEYVVKNVDMDDYLKEIDRVTPLMTSLGQDPYESVKFIRDAFPNAEETNSKSIFRIKFLASPVKLVGNEKGELISLEVEENTLVVENESIKARGTGKKFNMDVDTIIFAIGDTVDPEFGLPFDRNEFVKNPKPRFPINGISFESFDPISLKIIEDVFLAGWARKASDGLVGNARKDGVNAAQVIDLYFESLETSRNGDVETINTYLQNKHPQVINKNDLNILIIEENKIAVEKKVENFKFSTNEEMISIIRQNQELIHQSGG
ncbi:MAG TPA: FAD-dependent oxidoreductase [Anaerolineaceae bacterium]|nr:FAD-dependent oxidoreductase [Anaerolineaceae bacterium]